MCFHLRDIVQILLGDFNHRNIQHINVLLADQIKQQIQRALKAVQYHFQGIGRDKQILRHIGNRLAEYPGNGGVGWLVQDFRGIGHAFAPMWSMAAWAQYRPNEAVTNMLAP